ncbi:MAG: right-handed parallel beta-helix repeat-containing protein [Pseudolysinimonas sp.]|uniref:right-handed parallel beta-helix repeat-containing protein n=1 Tax=Pseudolysinimonas sp. TaxID=2680009 RepID=UPI0032642888
MTRLIAAVAAILLIAVGLLTGSIAASAAPTATFTSPDTVTAGRDYPGNPDTEAPLVAAEERRIIDIRTTLQTALLQGVVPRRPFRLTTTGVPTIVLVGRSAPYTIDELARIAPRSVEKRSDGSYLISEHIYVAEGATLRIDGVGVKLLLASNAHGFVSIVADGGTLVIRGDASSPLEVGSWDSDAVGPDLLTDDGRAYVRVYGGHAEITDAKFEQLGFWSGITGGLAITGSVIPEPLIADDPTSAAQPLDENLVSLGPDASPLDTLALEGEPDGAGYASALLQSVETIGNAFGLFVTAADRVDIRGSSFENSLVDGLVFHRDVTNSTVSGSVATGNAQDGFNLTRATSSVVFDDLEARDNGRNGITIEGRALVDGPSATGIAVSSYGGNEVRNSTSAGNGRYGIEVVGGFDINIIGNEVSNNLMGIVVTSGATGVTIRANEVSGSTQQGIAVRDSGADMSVVDNRVDGGEIGIYLRDAGGRIEDNRVSKVSNHGIALVGATGGSVIVGNTIDGSGPSAIDVSRSTGMAVRDNDATGWHDTKPLAIVLARIFQPLTVMWLVIALLLIVTLVMRRRRRVGVNPYADQAPLSSFTRGIVPRAQVGSRVQVPNLGEPSTGIGS